jgi:hypothetical protein
LRLAGVLLAGSACVSYGEGMGEVRGSVRVGRCTISGVGNYLPAEIPAFDLQPSFFVAERRGNVLQIQLRRDARMIHATDALFIDLHDVTRIPVGSSLTVRPDFQPGGDQAATVRMALSLSASCPRFQSGLLGQGTITFQRLDVRDEGVVEATFEVDLLDAHSIGETGAAITVGSLRGRFVIPLHFVGEPG